MASLKSADFTGLVLRSVPAHEARYLGGLPGATTEGPGRILSCMIHDQLTPDDLQGFTAVITRSDGYDHLPAAWMREHGVAGYHLEGYATDSVAHLALTMLLALARRIPESMASTRTDWTREHLVGRHLPELRVGVVGLGRIGRRLVALLDALGVATVGYDIDPEAVAQGTRHTRGTLADVQACDAITLHVPLDASTRRLVDTDFLAHMRPGSLLVNTARGDVVDTAAIAASLDGGHLAGYAADVLPDEPAAPDRALLAGRPDVLLTPHIGAQNHGTIAARYAQLAHIATALLEGRPEDVAAYRVI